MATTSKTGRATLFVAFGFVLVAALLIGCTPAPATPQQPEPTGSGVNVVGTYTEPQSFDPQSELEARKFSSEEEFRDFVRGHSGEAYFGGVYMGRGVAGATAVAAPMAADSMKSEGAVNSYSGTNNQVVGVDEADILKTDGNYIYTVTGNTVFIIKAYPGEAAEVVATIDLKQAPTGLFVDGDTLVVIGNFYDLDYFKRIDFRPRNGMTYETLYDISDKEHPKVKEEYKFEGTYFGARMHEGHVYLIVTSGPDYREEYPTPLIVRDDVKSSVPISDVMYYPLPYNNVQFATVHALDLATTDVASKTVTMEGGATLYASENNIYLAANEYINEWEIRQEITQDLLEPKLTDKDRAIIKKIEQTDSDVLSPQEKKNKISQIYQDYANYMGTQEQQDFQDELDKRVKARLEKYDSLEYMVIHKISFDGNNIEIGGVGEVPGTLSNQFAMDEHDGVLRVATTINQQWRFWDVRPVDTISEKMAVDIMPRVPTTQSTNNVYALDADMNVIGKLEGLAEGETIFSTRFIGDRLYMVTFRQVDPFFVIDLSNPRKPKELGQLKIPGFSRYLHPYDDTHIIGIGRDASDTGRQQGLKISLFDVSNVEKPVEVAKFVTNDDYAQSTAEWEHKAFLFDKAKELLVIPAYSYDWSKPNGGMQYNGAMVFRITPTQITMRGIVDHSKGQTQNYGALVERSLYIEDLLYTKSPGLLRINDLETLKGVKDVRLESTSAGPYPVY